MDKHFLNYVFICVSRKKKLVLNHVSYDFFPVVIQM